MTIINRRFGHGLGLALLVAGMALLPSKAWVAPAYATSEDNETDPQEAQPEASGMLAKGILQGLGVIPSTPKTLKYMPRPPLVVPKDLSNLPKPADAKVYEAAAGWPVDQDVVEARRMQRIIAETDASGNRRLTPEENAAIQQVLAENAGASEQRLREIAEAKKMSNEELQQLMQRVRMREFYDMNGNPVRTAMQNPPADYFKPAPGAPVTTEEPDYIKAAKRKTSLFGWFF